MKEDLTPVQMTVLLVFTAVILLCQSIFLFLNARKHGHNYWLWGIVGLIQAPVPLIIYLLFVRKIWRKSY
nr:sigma-Y antisigma factor component [Mesobacillus harenae]